MKVNLNGCLPAVRAQIQEDLRDQEGVFLELDEGSESIHHFRIVLLAKPKKVLGKVF